jgi:hypothetical protein
MPTYIVRAGDNGPVKIGRASDVARRVAELQLANPERLTVIRIIDTPFDNEAVLHARFAHRSLHGEWFSFDPEMLTFIPQQPLRRGAKDRVKTARKAAREEMQSLIREAFQAFFLIENQPAFFVRVARELDITKRRAKAFYFGEARTVEVHEMILMKEFVDRLRAESPRAMAKSTKPDDLLRDC